MNLNRIKEAVASCNRCGLCQGRRKTVPGEGPDTAKVMIIGEAPGMTEDALGRPFVGPSGRLLDRLLKEIGLERSKVFITNVVKCRPPDNRNPEQAEIDACQRFLLAQLKLLRPEVVITLGTFATQALLATETPISQIRGSVQDYTVEFSDKPIQVIPTFHPAYVLRNMSKLSLMQDDFKTVNQTLQGVTS